MAQPSHARRATTRVSLTRRFVQGGMLGAVVTLAAGLSVPTLALAGTAAQRSNPALVRAVASAGAQLRAHTLGGTRSALSASSTSARGLPRAVPDPGPTSDELEGAACPSASRCWAVGSYNNAAGAGLNEALYWNGATWSQASTPNPGGTLSGDYSLLDRVACTSPTRCWAVGDYTNSAGARLNEILRWTGATWSLSTTPNPGGTASNDASYLEGIFCTSATNCWATGYYQRSVGGVLNEMLRWNGTTWAQVATPNPSGTASSDGNELLEVGCSGSADCWAVGINTNSAGADLNEILHWNGAKWSTVAAPDPGTTASAAEQVLFSVTCASPSSCWAVGGYETYSLNPQILNQILHWNGTKWSTVANPQPGVAASSPGTYLEGVRCTSAGSCWAVGKYTNLYGATVNQALHWNGSSWSLVSTPNPGGISGKTDSSILVGVGCGSAGSCWAVGEANSLNEALHWNGSSWVTG